MIERYGSTITYGTIFSGSDLVNPALTTLSYVWRDLYGQEVEFKQLFLVEKEAWRRDFCAAHWGCQHAFQDALQLEAEDWVGWDEISKQCIPVPAVDINIAGFECDSLSNCNINRLDHHDCVEKGEDKTGTTAKALLSFTLLRRPGLSWWENVKQLRGKHLAWLIAWCLAHGFILVPNIICALLYGAACRRERQWMLVLDVMGEDVPVPKDVQDSWAPRIQQFSSCLLSLQIGQSPLHEFLLPATDAQLLQWQASQRLRRQQLDQAKAKAKAKATKPKPTSKPKPKPTAKPEATTATKRRLEKLPVIAGAPSSGAVQHLELFMQEGLEWPPDWSLCPEADQASQHLPERARDIIYFHSLCKREDPQIETVHDVNMSMGWGGQAESAVPCIVCTSKMWLRLEQRQLYGGELLALQGCPYYHLHHDRFSHDEMTVLAGNAFNAFCTVAVVTATFATMEVKRRQIMAESENEDIHTSHSQYVV